MALYCENLKQAVGKMGTMKFSHCQPDLEHKMKPPKCLCNFFSILHLKNLPQNSAYSPIQKKMVTILRSVPEIAQNVL